MSTSTYAQTAAAQDGRNRRQEERCFKSFPVKYRLPRDIFQPSKVFDISATGVRMEANSLHLVGTTVTLHLRPEPERLMSLQAQIVWINRKNGTTAYEMGLHFTDGQPADMAWLRCWLTGATSARNEMEYVPSERPRPAAPSIVSNFNGNRNGNPSYAGPASQNGGSFGRSDLRLSPMRQVPKGSGFRCSCGAEFALRVELAIHCENERHEAAPAGAPVDEVATPTTAPAAQAASNSEEKSHQGLVWGALGIAFSGLVAGGILQFYSTWMPLLSQAQQLQ